MLKHVTMITCYAWYHTKIAGENQGNDWQRNSIYKTWNRETTTTTTTTRSDSIMSNNNMKEIINNSCNDILLKDVTVKTQGDVVEQDVITCEIIILNISIPTLLLCFEWCCLREK